jgi:glucose/arabinose dehydrogenase
MFRPHVPIVALLAALLAWAACGSGDDLATAPPGTPPPTPPTDSTPTAPPTGQSDSAVSLGLQQVASGLNFPVYLTAPPGDASRLFILEKGGTVRIVKEGALLPTPFLDLSGRVGTRNEQGLLGLAFDPDYASNGRFVVHYDDVSGNTVVSAFRVSAEDADRADPASEALLLSVQQPGPNHKGGQILFGPDRMLYIGLGDGGGSGDPNGMGQSLTDLLGNILRLDVSAGAGYTVPPDNPFAGRADARPELWSVGLRNPWRFTIDPATGDTYIADVGEHDWEEVDVVTAAQGAGRGANFGWNVMEGNHCFGGGQCDPSRFTLPVLEYSHSEGCTVIGGFVYRGAAIPALQGRYFYADYCKGWVRSFRLRDGAAVDLRAWPTLSPGGLVTSFGEDAAGELYLVSAEGLVFKIVPQ